LIELAVEHMVTKPGRVPVTELREPKRFGFAALGLELKQVAPTKLRRGLKL